MPLSQNARVGLVVGGAAALVFLACAGGVIGLVVAQRERGAGPATAGKGGEGKPGPVAGKGLAERPMSEGSEKDDESYIAGHRWWKKPPTKERLNEIVTQIIETNEGSAVFINDVGRTGISSFHDDQFGWLFVKPEDLGKRTLCIECRGAVRPTRKKVLTDIRLELDFREYRSGPGR